MSQLTESEIIDSYKEIKDKTIMDLETYIKSVRESEKRSILFREKKKERYEKDVSFLKQSFNSFIEGTILKLDSQDPFDNEESPFEFYKNLTGVDPLKENTLTVADDNNNSYLVFKKEHVKLSINVNKNIQLVEKLRYDENSIIRNRIPPASIPDHLRNVIFVNINNNITNIEGGINLINNFNNINISENNGIKEFLLGNKKEGVMYPIKDIKKHSCWKQEYRKMLEVRSINICKACRKKWIKGCCSEYSQNNRTKTVMVIGWKKV